MPIDFDALRAAGDTQGVPDDGLHNARLDRAHIAYGTSRGNQIVTNWSANGVAWETWSPLDDPQWLWQTKDLLTGLGIDLAHMNTDADLENALADRETSMYGVRTESRRGSKGDRWFTSTYIEAAQLPLTDVPAPEIDATDYAAPTEPDDDSIPF